MTQSATAAASPSEPQGFLGQPSGLWVLVFTETWERFSHYGMRAILMLYLTLPVSTGALGLDKPHAAAIFGGYLLAIYLFALSGGQIADRFLGAKRTILLGGTFIALGQLGLQIRSLNGLVASLVLISVGTCLAKPNISASVGRLFAKDDPRRDGAFTYEYMGINIGASIAPFVCGIMAENEKFVAMLRSIGLASASGWAWAFGVSGAGMLLSLVNFVLRRKLIRDVNLPAGEKEPAPTGIAFVAGIVLLLLGLAWMVLSSSHWMIQLTAGAIGSALMMFGVQMIIKRGWVKTRTGATPVASATAPAEHVVLSREDWTRVGVVGMMLCFSMTFWFVFQQAGSSLVLFAKEYTNLNILGFEVPAAWTQSINAIFIVVLGSVFAWIWTKRAGKWPSSPIKFALALLFAALGFFLLVPAAKIAQAVPGSITKVNLGWLVGVYLLHTFGELCLSPVGLSYVSKLAPKQISSQLMGAWFFATGLGSYGAGKIAGLMDQVPLATIFGVCALIALGASLLLWLVVSRIITRLMGGYS
jgi:proton-dependent oligopeptide transporter, POT family